MSDKYILDEAGEAVRCEDVQAWYRWFAEHDRRIVARAEKGIVSVSTVFLGTDHSFGLGPPLLFETLVFGGPLDGEQDRYSTRQEAIDGHVRMVARVWPVES